MLSLPGVNNNQKSSRRIFVDTSISFHSSIVASQSLYRQTIGQLQSLLLSSLQIFKQLLKIGVQMYGNQGPFLQIVGT